MGRGAALSRLGGGDGDDRSGPAEARRAGAGRARLAALPRPARGAPSAPARALVARARRRARSAAVGGAARSRPARHAAPRAVRAAPGHRSRAPPRRRAALAARLGRGRGGSRRPHFGRRRLPRHRRSALRRDLRRRRARRSAGRGGGRGEVVSGTVDRLLVAADRILVVDFKTGRRAPADLAAVPDHHLRQMSAYAAALGVIFPGRPVAAALLYTAGPTLIELPAAVLDAHKPGFRGQEQKQGQGR
ncbi:PD-(D/E)XK nuclease family protein [Rhizorhabdus histidinilytica]